MQEASVNEVVPTEYPADHEQLSLFHAMPNWITPLPVSTILVACAPLPLKVTPLCAYIVILALATVKVPVPSST